MEALGERAARAAWDRSALDGAVAEAGLVLMDDAGVRDLNRDYRGQDKATNVLSFAALDGGGPAPVAGQPLVRDLVMRHLLAADLGYFPLFAGPGAAAASRQGGR